MKKGVITLGEALIDFIPLDKENMEFKKNPGGAPANVAVGISRLGAKSSFIGKVGNDLMGRFLKKVLDDEGVKTQSMVLTDEAKTGLVFVTLGEGGERSFEFYIDPSADTLLREEDINESIFKENKLLHFGSISLIHQPAARATRYAVDKAKEAGMLISYDPNLRLNLWPDEQRAKDTIISILDKADILKVSEEELEFITGIKDLEKGVKVLSDEYNVDLIYVTFGSKGSYYYHNGELNFIPAMKVEAVDTTGAGDAFVSGILYNINEINKDLTELNKEEMDNITRFAAVSGALAASQKGAMSALPTLDKVEDILEEK
ncbi:aminoimidazole riboside kinase [Halonatronum saccharophilum]|uniref:aminoimidazole riboside kinase n=1 Tax=Halonatronum saccharophilum TaxID=150060 RepID=UPI0004804387|nr:aminoimidazole riboside kinase [Halonatronum saccharophilum]